MPTSSELAAAQPNSLEEKTGVALHTLRRKGLLVPFGLLPIIPLQDYDRKSIGLPIRQDDYFSNRWKLPVAKRDVPKVQTQPEASKPLPSTPIRIGRRSQLVPSPRIFPSGNYLENGRWKNNGRILPPPDYFRQSPRFLANHHWQGVNGHGQSRWAPRVFNGPS